MKLCSCCKKEKTKSLFYKDNKNKDGLSSWCNECRKANVKRHRENPDYRRKQQEWNNKWRIKNPEKVLEIRRRSQRKIYLGLKRVGFVTPELRKQLLERDGNKCLACGKESSLTVDHIVPITLGGKGDQDNLQTLCRGCNSKKQRRSTCYRNMVR